MSGGRRGRRLTSNPLIRRYLMVSPTSSRSSRQKVHDQLLLQHFAALDIEMIYKADDEGETEHTEISQELHVEKERADSVDLIDIVYSDH